MATNKLDISSLSDKDIIKNYKEQQGVERGFRFLKDPWFMANTFFVKKKSRLTALMMVMTFSLFVYNYMQQKMRDSLIKNEAAVIHQSGGATQRPTMRWIFQLLGDISIVIIKDLVTGKRHQIMKGLNESERQIINFMGPPYCEMYQFYDQGSGM